jgi:hypothetical protein
VDSHLCKSTSSSSGSVGSRLLAKSGRLRNHSVHVLPGSFNSPESVAPAPLPRNGSCLLVHPPVCRVNLRCPPPHPFRRPPLHHGAVRAWSPVTPVRSGHVILCVCFLCLDRNQLQDQATAYNMPMGLPSRKSPGMSDKGERRWSRHRPAKSLWESEEPSAEGASARNVVNNHELENVTGLSSQSATTANRSTNWKQHY